MKNENFRLILKINENIEIKANSFCWLLYTTNPRSFEYYSNLEDALTALLNLRIKQIASNSSDPTIESLKNSIEIALKEIAIIISSLSQIKSPALDRMSLHESQSKETNE